MKIPVIYKVSSANIIHLSPDQNERFVLKNCVKYIHRHFLRYRAFDRETLKIIYWALGSETKPINDFLVEQVVKKRRSEFKQELSDNMHDLDAYVEFVFQSVRRLKGQQLQNLRGLAIELMDKVSKRTHGKRIAEIKKNVTTLKRMFDLTQHEVEFIIFLFIISTYEAPQEFFINHLECNKVTGEKYLANLLGITKRELNEILTGTLKKIKFFEMDDIDLKVESDFLGLYQNPKDQNFSQQFYMKVRPAAIPLDYYFISGEEKDYVLGLLKKKQKTATHVLLYGSPGSGKTSFAHSLADRLETPTYEIVRDETNTTHNRRAAILACLNMTNVGKGSLIIVDEADNLLNTQFSWFVRGETQDKGWLNELLEKNGTRMIWITNNIDGIDESVLRRFSFSLHFKPFNRRQRCKLWKNIVRRNRVKTLFDPSELEALAKRYKVSAAVIDLALKKAIELGIESKMQFHRAVKLALEANEALINHGEKPVDKNQIERNYSLEGLNIKGNLKDTITQLERFDRFLIETNKDQVVNMNLLLYGPPGTGKSELARYIAHHLDREIICKRVSDLQSKYVGEGEKNIKQAFKMAEAEEAVLIIDEADSILFRRESAHRSWEISFTNEFLTQMERFRGILICTTNRLKGLDEASIRRFNQKLGFDHLLPDGNVIFYEKVLKGLTKSPLDIKTKSVLQNLTGLTPGDFKTVRDRFWFYPQEEIDHQILVEALREESRIKNLHKNSKIGF
ncbi:MAG: AAA family ATPase [Desulfobacterales bacterium]